MEPREMRRFLMRENDSLPSREPTAAMAAAVAACTAIFAFAIYARTMAPTITWRNAGADSGDFVTAAINLGVPHPTGYPLYTMIAHGFTALPGAEPARNVTLLSALAAALAVGATFWAAYRLIATREDSTAAIALAAAWAAAGVYAFGELLWSQATIAEVYGLNALLVAMWVALALSLPLRARPYALALLFGLGLAHHVTIVWLLAALWPYVPAIRRWLTPKRVLQLGLCLLPGLLVYLYIPIRAATHPVPNWGQADSLSGFFWLVSGAVYRLYLRTPVPSHLLQRLSAWAGIWVRDIGVLGLALALLGLWRGLETDYAMLYVTLDSYLYLIPAAIIIALWMARGAFVALHALLGWAQSGLRRQVVTVTGILILAVLPLISIATRFPAMDVSADYEAYAFAENVLAAAAPDAIVLSDGDKQTFALWYLRYGLGRRRDVMVLDRRLLALNWYRDDLASQHPELAMLADASHAQEAITILVQEGARRHPVHLTYSDDFVFGLAEWSYEDPLFTLLRE